MRVRFVERLGPWIDAGPHPPSVALAIETDEGVAWIQRPLTLPEMTLMAAQLARLIHGLTAERRAAALAAETDETAPDRSLFAQACPAK